MPLIVFNVKADNLILPYLIPTLHIMTHWPKKSQFFITLNSTPRSPDTCSVTAKFAVQNDVAYPITD